MSDRERENFLNGAISRAPGKRQIKPTNLATDEFVPHDESDSDEEFVGELSSENGSDESGSGESSENEEDESNGVGPSNSNDSDIQVIDTVKSSKPEPLICSVCLNMRKAEGDRVIQCDKCGVTVHEGCYAVNDEINDNASVISNFSTEPWFCEPCLFDLEKPPHCELCPSQFGAFKRADVGGKWVHLTCAMFTPGISFGDIENLTAISWQEIDYKRFGRKACNGCTNILEARTGITTNCEAGMCKHHFHISCAQRLGFLIDAESENLPELSGKHVDPHFILCRTHNITELVAKKRQNYAIFLRQEQKRLVILNRRMLDQRETYKLSRQRKQFDDRMNTYHNVTIHLPAIHNKRPRLLQSSADFLEAFAEKAELFGVSLQEFTDGFTRLPPAQISYLAPSFSTEFVKYFEHRENNVFSDEEKRLREDECELKKVIQAEEDLKLMLGRLSTKSPESSRSSKQRTLLDHKFTSLCKKLGITFEEEEETKSSKSESLEPPKLKKQKIEEQPKKRPKNQTHSQKDNLPKSPPKLQRLSSTNFRPLKNGNYGRNRRSSVLSGSLDSNIEESDNDTDTYVEFVENK